MRESACTHRTHIIHMHIHENERTHTETHMRESARARAHTHTCTHTHVHTYTHPHLHTHTHTHAHLHMYRPARIQCSPLQASLLKISDLDSKVAKDEGLAPPFPAHPHTRFSVVEGTASRCAETDQLCHSCASMQLTLRACRSKGATSPQPRPCASTPTSGRRRNRGRSPPWRWTRTTLALQSGTYMHKCAVPATRDPLIDFSPELAHAVL
jgi:hypothetical protein